MSEFCLLASGDTSVLAEILGQTYSDLENLYVPMLNEPNKKVPENIGLSPACVPMSEIVTIAAHKLGILASREQHPGHRFTSFGPLNELPGEDDLILCTTWGQFSPQAFLDNPQPFFGPRGEIRDLVQGKYSAYDPNTTKLRQTTYAKTENQATNQGPLWLDTTPGDIVTGQYPVGLAPYKIYDTVYWSWGQILYDRSAGL